MKLSLEQIKNTLENTDPRYTEELASQAKNITEQYFGRTISLYAPLYLSNYCSSYCTYCGFNNHQRIKRTKLGDDQIQTEMKHVSAQRIESILLLTGESYEATPLSYLKKAVSTAKSYFTNIGLEVYPMSTEDYKELYFAGADSVTIYQETYSRDRYKEVHLSGKKTDYDFRYHAPQRIAEAGIRQISLGILLGLGPVAEDLFDLYSHLRWLEKNYPGVEYSISFPRLRKIKGVDLAEHHIDDITLIKIICLTRTLFPRVGINLSTRESASLRDNLLGLGITRISAGSNTSVGGYQINIPEEQDPQFDIDDDRSLSAIIAMLIEKDFDPILTDWRAIKNT